VRAVIHSTLAAFYLPEAAAAAAAAAGSTAPPISSSSFIATLPEPASRSGLMQRGVAGYRPKVRRHPRGGLGVDIFTRICQGGRFSIDADPTSLRGQEASVTIEASRFQSFN